MSLTTRHRELIPRTQPIYAKAADTFNYSSAYIEAFQCFGDTSNCIDPDGRIAKLIYCFIISS